MLLHGYLHNLSWEVVRMLLQGSLHHLSWEVMRMLLYHLSWEVRNLLLHSYLPNLSWRSWRCSSTSIFIPRHERFWEVMLHDSTTCHKASWFCCSAAIFTTCHEMSWVCCSMTPSPVMRDHDFVVPPPGVVDQRTGPENPNGGPLHLHDRLEVRSPPPAGQHRVDAQDKVGAAPWPGELRVPDHHQAHQDLQRLPQSRRLVECHSLWCEPSPAQVSSS